MLCRAEPPPQVFQPEASDVPRQRPHPAAAVPGSGVAVEVFGLEPRGHIQPQPLHPPSQPRHLCKAMALPSQILLQLLSPRHGGGCLACLCFGRCRAGSSPHHTGQGSDGVEEMPFVLSHPLAEAHGGRSEASSHICVVMVNFHPGTGKPWRFPKISQALCGCWAFLGSGMEWLSAGVCQHADRVSGSSTCPAGNATLSCCDCAASVRAGQEPAAALG